METKSSQIKRLLEQEGMSFAKIAKTVGCQRRYVAKIKKEFDNPKEKTHGSIKIKIKKLLDAGYSRKQIMKKLGCSKSMVSYVATDKKRNQKRCYVSKKLFYFKNREENTIVDVTNCSPDEDLSNFCEKISSFRKASTMQQGTTPTKKNVLEKFSGNPCCGLCGTTCDFKNSKSYSFDHYIPKSRGGDNSLENMQLLCMECNMMKHAMLQEEFLEKCKMIVEYNKL